MLGVLPGIIGTMQAIETIKLITGLGESLLGRLLHFDALKMKFREFKLRRDSSARSGGKPNDLRADRLRIFLRDHDPGRDGERDSGNFGAGIKAET